MLNLIPSTSLTDRVFEFLRARGVQPDVAMYQMRGAGAAGDVSRGTLSVRLDPRRGHGLIVGIREIDCAGTPLEAEIFVGARPMFDTPVTFSHVILNSIDPVEFDWTAPIDAKPGDLVQVAIAPLAGSATGISRIAVDVLHVPPEAVAAVMKAFGRMWAAGLRLVSTAAVPEAAVEMQFAKRTRVEYLLRANGGEVTSFQARIGDMLLTPQNVNDTVIIPAAMNAAGSRIGRFFNADEVAAFRQVQAGALTTNLTLIGSRARDA